MDVTVGANYQRLIIWHARCSWPHIPLCMSCPGKRSPSTGTKKDIIHIYLLRQLLHNQSHPMLPHFNGFRVNQQLWSGWYQWDEIATGDADLQVCIITIFSVFPGSGGSGANCPPGTSVWYSLVVKAHQHLFINIFKANFLIDWF